jgi:hypothetical protein
MNPDAVSPTQRTRWWSPRGAAFWILAPIAGIASALAILMFWPGLVYEWHSSEEDFVLRRFPIASDDSGRVRGDVFEVNAKWFEILKSWDPAGVIVGRGPWLETETRFIFLRFGEDGFVLSW